MCLCVFEFRGVNDTRLPVCLVWSKDLHSHRRVFGESCMEYIYFFYSAGNGANTVI